MSAQTWMQRALTLAKLGEGYVEPNPMVGAVLVRDGAIVAEGFHRRFGGPHAEVEALRDAREKGIDPAGLTMVVTLEPCRHFGKTPPCTRALIEAGVGKVIVAMEDPFEKVAGGGIGDLRAAGIEVEVGVEAAAARELVAPFVKRITTGMPYGIAKWAQTIDGKIATATGDSKWISSDASRQRVHELRARVDAIVVGIGTVAADDPKLTARDVEVKRTARRIVIDPHLRIGSDVTLLTDAGPPVLIAYEYQESNRTLSRKRNELEARGVELFPLKERCGHRLDLRPLMRHLVETYAATNVIFEGGGGLLGSVYEQDLVDETWVFQAPKLVGDWEAPSALKGIPCATIAEARQLALRDVERIGDDVLLRYVTRMD